MLALVLALGLLATQPNHSLTPGVWKRITLHEVCTKKWGLDQRAVTDGMRAQVFASYGYSGNSDPRCNNPSSTTRRCEVDHLYPRELGGADAVANLWIQPYAGAWSAQDKDRLENYGHTQACKKINPMPLSEARALFVDWHAGYVKAFGGPPLSAR